ncbi:eCIS core domain-containing protein [Pseudonocardia sp. CA-107938]|uniref:eCIS core domain-containing protein n=1 Tax=Pseudonocardia sp. CA-107938 TaxID=3240021 RepID=UPI003D8A072D
MRAPAFDVAAPVAATVGAPLRRPAGRGRPLDPAVRERMAAAFGTGFDAVRVHTDGASDAFNREVSASASTLGDHIYFRSGAYQPGTGAGQRLLAHELTHVVQQRGSGGGAPRLGPIGGTAEAQADAAAARVAAGGSVDPGSLAPVAAGTVQRRYLDRDAITGRRNWITDTPSEKDGSVKSRGALDTVDRLLRKALAAKGYHRWHELLIRLDTALEDTAYYAQSVFKTREHFTQREAAVQRLHGEIYAELPSDQPNVAALQVVGLAREYLESLPSGQLDELYTAHAALARKDWQQAQLSLDTLNPPVMNPARAKRGRLGWRREEYKSEKLAELGGRFDFERTRDDMMAAQRQLLAYHAPTIGGTYATLMSYKPYKAKPLKAEVRKRIGDKYLNPDRVRRWRYLEDPGQGGAPTLDSATAETAPKIRDEYTMASATRMAEQGRSKKGAKELLTREEIAALRVITGDSYRELNAVFRDFRVHGHTANWVAYSNIAKLAVSGLGKLPKLRGNTITFRGDYDIDHGGHQGVLKQGAIFRLPNFYSTTRDWIAAFPGTLGYVFHNKQAGRHIRDLSTSQHEDEVLIPPGTPFRITNVFRRFGDESWRSDDGLDLTAAAPAVRRLAKNPMRRRQVVIELEEIVRTPAG